MIHPVEIIGYLISKLTDLSIRVSNHNSLPLTICGAIISSIVIGLCGITGLSIEYLTIESGLLDKALGLIILSLCLSSMLAAKSLRRSVNNVLKVLPKNPNKANLEIARKNLGQIVGRDVEGLSEENILRACCETSSENSVDGVFAPLFWMIVGVVIQRISPVLPGPLTLSLIYKGTSTIDSMIGYKRGDLLWLGKVGAKLDDYLTWLPCRILVIMLPLISKPWGEFRGLIKKILTDGSQDESPNSGLSEAAFAYCTNVEIGGPTLYKNKYKYKPIFAKGADTPNIQKVTRILNLNIKLEITWLILLMGIELVIIQ